MAAQAAPNRVPAISTRGKRRIKGKSGSKIPTAAAPVAPIINWPSPPILNFPARNGMVKARAINSRGTNLRSVCTKPLVDLNEVVRIVLYASSTLKPMMAMKMPAAAKAASTAPI